MLLICVWWICDLICRGTNEPSAYKSHSGPGIDEVMPVRPDPNSWSLYKFFILAIFIDKPGGYAQGWLFLNWKVQLQILIYLAISPWQEWYGHPQHWLWSDLQFILPSAKIGSCTVIVSNLYSIPNYCFLPVDLWTISNSMPDEWEFPRIY